MIECDNSNSTDMHTGIMWNQVKGAKCNIIIEKFIIIIIIILS